MSALQVSRGRVLLWSALGGAAVLGFALLWRQVPYALSSGGDSLRELALVLLMLAAAALFRRLPAAALALVWTASLLQVLSGLAIAPVQLASLLVSYGTARYGRSITVWLAGLSLPMGAVLVLLHLLQENTPAVARVPLGRTLADEALSLVSRSAGGIGTGLLLLLALLAAPWVLGLLLRLDARYRAAQAQRGQAEEQRRLAQAQAAQAREVADARAAQARLARDVHDIVGHSLAVIIAQADSAQFLPDSDTARLRQAMANVATSARQSLADVRGVLSSLDESEPGARGPAPADLGELSAELDRLVEGVRETGREVRTSVEGQPRALDPGSALAAFRVLQEMLTNALRHGDPGGPIVVTRRWDVTGLCLEVRNPVVPGRTLGPPGRGLAGMEQRLQAVGGLLEHGREGPPERMGYAASARVPVVPDAARSPLGKDGVA